MYVEGMGMSTPNVMSVNAVKQPATKQQSAPKQSAADTADAVTVKQPSVSINTAKLTTSPAEKNVVRAESTEGAVQQNGKAVQDKKDITAIYNQNNDTHALDEKRAAENEKIRKAIENMRAQLPNSEVKFGIHEKTDRVMIKLLDKGTKEVIREFPPEKTLDMIAKCMEFAGILVDEKM